MPDEAASKAVRTLAGFEDSACSPPVNVEEHVSLCLLLRQDRCIGQTTRAVDITKVAIGLLKRDLPSIEECFDVTGPVFGPPRAASACDRNRFAEALCPSERRFSVGPKPALGASQVSAPTRSEIRSLKSADIMSSELFLGGATITRSHEFLSNLTPSLFEVSHILPVLPSFSIHALARHARVHRTSMELNACRLGIATKFRESNPADRTFPIALILRDAS